jgi:hypothetical protein
VLVARDVVQVALQLVDQRQLQGIKQGVLQAVAGVLAGRCAGELQVDGDLVDRRPRCGLGLCQSRQQQHRGCSQYGKHAFHNTTHQLPPACRSSA